MHNGKERPIHTLVEECPSRFADIYKAYRPKSSPKTTQINTHVSETDFRKFTNPLDELFNDTD